MLTVKKVQENSFESIYFKKFEDDMVEHVKKYFPNHFVAMQEENTRKTIQYCYGRATKYGFESQRNVCHYLNNMLVLGGNFDIDPQFPWAIEILNETKKISANSRAAKLSNKTLEIFTKISGPHHINLNRALRDLYDQSETIKKEAKQSNINNLPQILESIFPRKYEIVGEVNMAKLIEFGINQANKYGLTNPPNLIIYVLFMFMSGAGFDKDPQFFWASAILFNSEIINQDQKTELLYSKAIDSLGRFLARPKQ